MTPKSLVAAACSVPANTRKRKLVCEKLVALFKFAGFTIDLSPYVGNYGASAAAPRYIPSAVEIMEVRSLFDDRPDWQWLYGVLATYELSKEIASAFLNALFGEVTNFCPSSVHGFSLATILEIQDRIAESCKCFDDFIKLFFVFREMQYLGKHLDYKKSKEDKIFYFTLQEDADMHLETFCMIAGAPLSSFDVRIRPLSDLHFDYFE